MIVHIRARIERANLWKNAVEACSQSFLIGNCSVLSPMRLPRLRCFEAVQMHSTKRHAGKAVLPKMDPHQGAMLHLESHFQRYRGLNMRLPRRFQSSKIEPPFCFCF